MEGTPVPGPLPGPDSAAARKAVQAPAILMMVISGLGLLFTLMSMVGSSLIDPAQVQELLSSQPDMPEWVREMAEKNAQSGSSILSNLPMLVLSALGFVGGLRMLSLQNYGLAVAGAVALLIPCVGSCCCLGMPVGGWALYVLTRPHVKGAFTR